MTRPPGALNGAGMEQVLAAARRLRGEVRETPLEFSPVLAEALGRPCYLKLESLQRTGSFKLRGALNAVASLAPEERAKGVVTASAGNHGAGVALAAGLHGARATVFAPRDAPATKRARIARLGAELRLVDGGYDQAHAAAEAHAERTGALYVHAFSDPRVVAGQATVGLEIFVALPEAATVVVPVGGGGLIGGIGVVARALRPDARVVGVQTMETSAMHASLAAGELRSPPMGPTLCEGLSGDIDQRSLQLARRVVDQVVLVEEAAVPGAIRRLYEEEGVVAEGSAAVTAAALYAGLVPAGDGPVVAVISGGNIDPARLAGILSGG